MTSKLKMVIYGRTITLLQI